MSALSGSHNLSENPPFAIFLDIDGVLLSFWDKRQAQDHPSKEALKDAENHEAHLQLQPNCYSNNYWSIIIAHHFSKEALNNLDTLIRKLEEVAKPQIIISSRWREGHTVEELRTIYFRMHPFAHFIIDKTPEKIPEIKFPLRSDEIQYWLNYHPEVKHYAILDDIDEKLGECFRSRFIHVNSRILLSKKDIEKALAANGFASLHAEPPSPPPILPSIAPFFKEPPYPNFIKAQFIHTGDYDQSYNLHGDFCHTIKFKSETPGSTIADFTLLKYPHEGVQLFISFTKNDASWKTYLNSCNILMDGEYTSKGYFKVYTEVERRQLLQIILDHNEIPPEYLNALRSYT